MQGIGLNHWQRYGARWSQVRPPLRPNAQVVGLMRALVGDEPGRALLLGVTPELATLFPTLDAVDKNPEVVASQWPGDSGSRRAIVADWLEFPAPRETYAVIAGDGSLNNAASAAMMHALIAHVHELLTPGGLFICRVFERPRTTFSEHDLQAAMAGRDGVNFHAFKWMMAMHLAEQHGMTVRVADILALFERLCVDRSALADRTGWALAEIDTIDVYRGSAIRYVFPNRTELIAAFPEDCLLDFIPTSDYDLAACCPILAFRKPEGGGAQ